MKVGTDAVLLGAWAVCDTARHIIDIGTGTGLIALMAAQRFPQAYICAIDADARAIAIAKQNFRASPWSDRITLQHCSLSACQKQYSAYFDCMLCNPPYFMNGFPQASSKKIARDAAFLPPEALMHAATTMLRPGGTLHLIYPAPAFPEMLVAAMNAGLFLCRRTAVSGREGQPPKRILAAFGSQPAPAVEDHLSITDPGGAPTHAFRKLMDAFYLPR